MAKGSVWLSVFVHPVATSHTRLSGYDPVCVCARSAVTFRLSIWHNNESVLGQSLHTMLHYSNSCVCRENWTLLLYKRTYVNAYELLVALFEMVLLIHQYKATTIRVLTGCIFFSIFKGSREESWDWSCCPVLEGCRAGGVRGRR